MRIRLTPRAVADLNAIADYVRERNPQAASRVSNSIQASLEMLMRSPNAGRRQNGGLRRLVTRKYRYLAYYWVNEADGEVVVVAIQHPSRRREHDDA